MVLGVRQLNPLRENLLISCVILDMSLKLDPSTEAPGCVFLISWCPALDIWGLRFRIAEHSQLQAKSMGASDSVVWRSEHRFGYLKFLILHLDSATDSVVTLVKSLSQCAK